MKRVLLVSLAALLMLALCACNPLQSAGKTTMVGIPGKADASPSLTAGTTDAATASADATIGNATAASPNGAPVDDATGTGMDLQAFSNAFRVLSKNPLEENLQHVLYLEAMASPPPGEGTASGNAAAMSAFVDQLQAQVDGNGLHYVDVMSFMGMDMEIEHWAKGNKFKRVEKLTGDVTIFDGTTAVKYNLDKKTGKKLEGLDLTAVQKTEGVGLLASLATAPYESKPDEKFGDWDCAVFYLSIEVLKMKGNTVYIDKATGLVVRNVYGDPKDAKNSMATVVKSIDTSPVGDDVFVIPTDIVIE